MREEKEIMGLDKNDFLFYVIIIVAIITISILAIRHDIHRFNLCNNKGYQGSTYNDLPNGEIVQEGYISCYNKICDEGLCKYEYGVVKWT